MRFRLRHLLLSIQVASLFELAAAPEVKSGAVQRKVLILDFENQTAKTDYDYLRASLAEALIDPIKDTKKFQVMSRENASLLKAKTGATISADIVRSKAIQIGQDIGADIVVLGKFAELEGVLMLTAQVFETDSKLLKVSEEVLTKSDANVFKGINELAEKISASMARELPMFDPVEAEMRRAEASRALREWRRWEIQFYGGYPYFHELYTTDGTVTYNKGFPVYKLKGYALGATVWESGLAKKIFFLPQGTRFGLDAKVTIPSGFVDVVGSNSQLLISNTRVIGQFIAAQALLAIPYLNYRRFAMYAELGGGAAYGKITTSSDTIFAATLPGAVAGISVGYHWPHFSCGIGYRAQVWFLSSTRAYMQHDAYLYVGVRF